MNPSYHPITEKIKQLLVENQYWFETFEHESVRTSEEAARVRTGYTLEQGAKALIITFTRDSKKLFAMLVMPAHLRFHGGKVKKILGSPDVHFATPEEVEKITGGIQVGGVPPFGNFFGLSVFTDPQLFEQERIIFNAGDRRFSVAMRSADFKTLVNPEIISIT